MECFLGFGVYRTITSGVICAKCIVDKNLNYQREVQSMVNENMNLYQLRLAMDKLDNKGFDLLLTAMDAPGMKTLIYNTNINFVKILAKMLSLGGQIPAKKFFVKP